MSTNTQELARSFAAVVGQEINKNFTTIVTEALANNASRDQLFPVVTGWMKTALERSTPGAANLNVPIAGAPPSGGAFPPQGFGAPNPLSAHVANVGPAAQQGFAPQQFGQPQGFGQQFGQPLAPAVNNALPKDTKATLQECGLCRVPLTHSNSGATCGVAHTTQSCPGMTLYCSAAATKPSNKSGLWTCSKHVSRESPEAKGAKGKKSGAGGPAVQSAQHIIGTQTATGFPQGFGNNPGAVNALSNMMGQQPAAPFGQQGQTFGQPQQPFGQQNFGAPANQAQSNQLFNSMQGQIGGIQQNPNPLAPGATFNANAALQQPAPSAVAVNPAFNNVPSTPAAPQQFGGQPIQQQAPAGFGFAPQQFGGQPIPQQAPAGFGFAPQQQQAPAGFAGFVPTQTAPVFTVDTHVPFAGGDDGSSDDEDSSEPGEEPMPVPVGGGDINAVMQQAGFGQPVGFGQAPQQPAGFGQAPPSALATALAQQQGQAPLAQSAPQANNPLAAMLAASQPAAPATNPLVAAVTAGAQQ